MTLEDIEKLTKRVTETPIKSLLLLLLLVCVFVGGTYLKSYTEALAKNHTSNEEEVKVQAGITSQTSNSYPLNYTLKVTDTSIIGDAGKFLSAPELVEISKVTHPIVCVAAYSEEYRLGQIIVFEWRLYDLAGNKLRGNSFFVTPTDSSYQARSCLPIFTSYPSGTYKLEVSVAGNLQEKRFKLIK